MTLPIAVLLISVDGLHAKPPSGVAADRPFTVAVFDEEKNTGAIVSEIRTFADQGLIVLQPAEFVPLGEQLAAKRRRVD